MIFTTGRADNYRTVSGLGVRIPANRETLESV